MDSYTKPVAILPNIPKPPAKQQEKALPQESKKSRTNAKKRSATPFRVRESVSLEDEDEIANINKKVP